ncbi:YciI family protein [Amycolatopsis sp. H20-H5]|uniref:YciI family protein n=1 Tax=Amycolatopsis sp. H20-H5 TaxID=3046309 RepID=UPI002DBC966D|nr:YciI family protein [Amycolatopsis sp. H20-H5]MEC3981898.1 YciI family protein [Amycolatopsis sp. H20-H5]
MAHYAGFMRGTTDAQAHLGPDEGQRVLESYLAWSDDLTRQGKLVSGNSLSLDGRVLRLDGDALASTDGPHTEATEVLGGLIVIDAHDLDEAEKTFGGHPHLRFGPIEVRRVEDCRDGN